MIVINPVKDSTSTSICSVAPIHMWSIEVSGYYDTFTWFTEYYKELNRNTEKMAESGPKSEELFNYADRWQDMLAKLIFDCFPLHLKGGKF